MSENDIGPQKGPASTARIEAQAKAIRNELEQLPQIKQTLAERLFEQQDEDWELYKELSTIFGASHPDDDDNEVIDYGWDRYDASVEVVRREGLQFMSRDQANQILALGFGMIYESIGDQCRLWRKNDHWDGARARKPRPKQLPKIKPLVWEDDEFGGSDAFSSIITYAITRTEEDDKDRPYIANWGDGWKSFELLSEAKAWCQAEYERRVRECLE